MTSRAGQARGGFTLLELMVVTVIIAVLTVIASVPIRKARERAFITAARSEINTALKFIIMYEVENGVFPANLTIVKNQGFEASGEINFCTYNHVAVPAPGVSYVQIVAMHRGSRTSVETRYPVWPQTQETPVPSVCTPLAF
jgi:prepilin-type N-terminal cleavage/methylation domain-containing protein